MNWLLASWPLRSPVPPLAAPTARAKTAIFRGHASCLGKTAPPARGKAEEPGACNRPNCAQVLETALRIME